MTQKPQPMYLAQSLTPWTSVTVKSLRKASGKAKCLGCGFMCPHTLERHNFRASDGSAREVTLCSYCHFYANPYRAHVTASARLVYLPEISPAEANNLIRLSHFLLSQVGVPELIYGSANAFLTLLDARVDTHREVFSTADIHKVGESLSMLAAKPRAEALKNLAASSRILFAPEFYQGDSDWWPAFVKAWSAHGKINGSLKITDGTPYRLLTNALKTIEA